MFGRVVYIHTLENFLQPKLRNLGHTSALLSPEMLGEAYMLAVVNFKKARDRQSSKMTIEISKVKVSDLT